MAQVFSSFLNACIRRVQAFGRAKRHRRHIEAIFHSAVALAAEDRVSAPSSGPFVSLIVPVYNTPQRYLDALLASVRQQLPGAWELILSDDGSTAPETCRWLEARVEDGDVKILRHARNLGIVAASNAAIAAASAPWITFVDHDDALAPYALERVWQALSAAPDCQFLFTDELVADGRLRPIELFLKPAFDPLLLSGVNYINHLSFFRRDRLLELGGLRAGFDGSQDYDLVLRYTRGLAANQRLHLPYPAYIWRRDGRSFSVSSLDRATENARRALADAYQSQERRPQVEAAEGNLHRLRFRSQTQPFVSVIIPSRDSLPLIRRTLEGLCEGTDYPNLEIIVIDNGTTDPAVLDLYERRRAGPTPFQALIAAEPFNFSRAINKGVGRARGDFLLLLNNDIEVTHRDWLTEMVECFAFPKVGVVGAKLLYPDRTYQHAGVIVGFGGLAGHWHLNEPANFPGPMGRLWVRQSLSAVTGACMLISRACWENIGPLDEAEFAIAYNDIDFCLRARKAGYGVVWTPFATLIHHESASRGSDETEANIARFRREQDNLRRRHATDVYQDFAISPWFTTDRSIPVPRRLDKLPSARPGA